MRALAVATSPIVPSTRTRSRRRANARPVVRAWWPFFTDSDTASSPGARDASSSSTSTSFLVEKSRRDRLDILSRSYVQRRAPPPLPEGYAVRVLPDPTKGSSKTRVEVTVADEAGSVPEVVGWITCWLKKTSEKKTSLFLSTVEVKRAHRRRGVAKRLLRETEYVALKLGASETSLMVLKNNAPAISLYESYGYEIDASGSLAAKLVSVISDPQRIAQHRMVKNVVVEG